MEFTSGITWFRQNKKQGDCQRREKRKELAAVDLMQLNVLAGELYQLRRSWPQFRTAARGLRLESQNARITRRCRREAAGSYGRTGGWVIG